MSTNPFPINAEQVAQIIARETRRTNKGRKVPVLAANLAKFAEQTQIYIFNVGPWDHKVEMGSWGTYHIPACPDDKQFVMGEPIPGVYTEPIPVNESTYQLETIQGDFVADQILGIGRNQSGNTSLVRLGVFKTMAVEVIKGIATPQREDLDAATSLLMDEYVNLVEEAELAYSAGPTEFKKIVGEDGLKHKLAAKKLGRTDVKWMQQVSAGKRVACPNCGEFADPQVISCSVCTYIFDMARYEKEILPRLAKAGRGKQG